MKKQLSRIVATAIAGIIVLIVQYTFFVDQDEKHRFNSNETVEPFNVPENSTPQEAQATRKPESPADNTTHEKSTPNQSWASQYLVNPQINNNPGQVELAIYVQSSNPSKLSITSQIGNVFKKSGYSVYHSFFSNKFSDEKLDHLILNNAGSHILSQELIKHIDRLIIATYDVESIRGNSFSQIEGMENMTTVQLEMNFYDYSSQSGMLENSYRLSTSGIDVRPSDAEEMAMKRLLDELSKKLQ